MRELVIITHHVVGYLKIAPEHTEDGPLSKMMKPSIGNYDRFKQLFNQTAKVFPVRAKERATGRPIRWVSHSIPVTSRSTRSPLTIIGDTTSPKQIRDRSPA